MRRTRIGLVSATALALIGPLLVTAPSAAITSGQKYQLTGQLTTTRRYAIKRGQRETVIVRTTRKGRKILRKKRITKVVVRVHGDRRVIRVHR